jgi:outer membrane protein TolC
MKRKRSIGSAALLCGATALSAVFIPACLTPEAHRHDADRTAYRIVEQTQRAALGKTESFTVESPADTLRRRLLLDQGLPFADAASLGTHAVKPIKQWPDPKYLQAPDDGGGAEGISPTDERLQFTLVDALQIGAHNSREYQSQKEQVFRTALELDLERDAFRGTWAAFAESLFSHELEQQVTIDDEGRTDRQPVSGTETGGTLDFTQRLKNGMSFTARIGLDLVSLLTQDRLSSRGVFADASITVPLLRGAGKFVVTEPLTQAEREVVYAIYEFERFKRTFAVRIASDYLSVLQQLDRVQNAEENYRRLVASKRRAARLAQAGRLDEIQVDQARQNELSARNGWISAQEAYARRLDAFKVSLGLPTDAAIELDREELKRLSAAAAALPGAEIEADAQEEVPAADAPIELVEADRENVGPLELDESEAIPLALEHRLDLRVEIGRVFDAQRSVAVAADRLRADLTLLGSGSAGARRTLGSAGSPDAILRPDEGSYSALLTLDLPLERTLERNAYRNSLIGLEQAVRNVQELEDGIKLDVRTGLSDLLEARESFRIQAEAVKLAQRRVESTNLFLEAGRAQIRDLLEAQESLVSAQNDLTAALVAYRVSELTLQRDLGVLEVNEQGLWKEYTP